MRFRKARNRRRRPKGAPWQGRLGLAKLWRRIGALRRGSAKRPVEVVCKAGPRPEALTDERPPRPIDLWLLSSTLILVALGIVLVYSASAVFAESRYGNANHFLLRHMVHVAIGLTALYVGTRLDLTLYQRFATPVLLAAGLLLVLLLLPGFGTRVDGATRWFRIAGVSIQPSELAKFALVVYLAQSLSRAQSRIRLFSAGFLPNCLIMGLIAVLLLRQPDLGNALILLATAVLMLMVAGVKISYLLLAGLAAAPFFYYQVVRTPWRLRRLLAFLNPWAYRHGAGYQVAESLIGVGAGGALGQGLGNGKQKLFFLPAAHTDFIFAILGEELGLLGLSVTVLLYAVLLWRGRRAACGQPASFNMYLAYGLTVQLCLQAVFHMCVVLGLVPAKGIGLPLISYGGSAMVMSLFGIGVLLRIGMRCPGTRERSRNKGPEAGNRRRLRRVAVA